MKTQARASERAEEPSEKKAGRLEDTSAPLVEDGRIWGSLRKIVAGFSGDAALQKDLLQECLVCLWKAECERPGETRSWYLQNCRFHVQHWLALGKSLDSPKRARGDNRIPIGGLDAEPALEEYHTNGELFESVSFQDVVLTLSRHLKPNEQAVLRGLAEGHVLRDVAARTKLSYPTALKYRRKIAALTLKLGIVPKRGKKADQARP